MGLYHERMRQQLRLFVIFGSLGAALSVMMAWGLVMIERPATATGALNRVEERDAVRSPQGRYRGAWRLESLSESEWWFSTELWRRCSDEGKGDMPAWIGDPFWGSDDDLTLDREGLIATATWTAQGWPFRCVRRVHATLRAEHGMGPLPQVERLERCEIPVRLGPIVCTLAYEPFWPGLLANIAFYGVILWALWFTPGALRRGLRRRRQACVRCGYDLRVADGRAACPECGAAPRERC
jgi:hypothetical protein